VSLSSCEADWTLRSCVARVSFWTLSSCVADRTVLPVRRASRVVARVRTRLSSPIFSRAAVALVKVGTGQYRIFKDARIVEWNATDLFDALIDSKVFGASLKGVMVDKCRVFVLTTPNKVPTTEEENTNAEELVGTDTIHEHAHEATTLFIRVDLPPTAGSAGTCPCSPLTRSPPPPPPPPVTC